MKKRAATLTAIIVMIAVVIGLCIAAAVATNRCEARGGHMQSTAPYKGRCSK